MEEIGLEEEPEQRKSSSNRNGAVISAHTFSSIAYIWSVFTGTPWGRFNALALLDRGVTPTQLGFLRLLGIPLKSIGYVVWGLLGDLLGVKHALLLTTVLSMLSLEPFRWRALYSSFAYVMLAKTTRSVCNGGWPLIDSVAVLAGGKANYGRLRLWGSVSWGVSALFFGMLLDSLYDYGGLEVIIHLSYALMVVYLLIIVFLFPQSLQRQVVRLSSGGGLRSLEPLFQPQIARFLFLGFWFGVCVGAASVVPVWIKTSLGGSAQHVGINTLSSVAFGLPIFIYHSSILNKFGSRRLMLLANGGHLLRMISYYAVTPGNFTVVIPLVESLHCFSFALYWTTATYVMHSMCPVRLLSTSQTLLASCHSLLGQGIGTAAALYIFEHYEIALVLKMAIVATSFSLALTWVLFEEPSVVVGNHSNNNKNFS